MFFKAYCFLKLFSFHREDSHMYSVLFINLVITQVVHFERLFRQLTCSCIPPLILFWLQLSPSFQFIGRPNLTVFLHKTKSPHQSTSTTAWLTNHSCKGLCMLHSSWGKYSIHRLYLPHIIHTMSNTAGSMLCQCNSDLHACSSLQQFKCWMLLTFSDRCYQTFSYHRVLSKFA